MQSIPLRDIADFIRTGKTPPTKDIKYFNGEIQWFTPGDLDKGKFLEKSARTLTDEAFTDKKAAKFPANTLLVACIGDIGKLGITTEESSSNQQITGIKPKDNVDVSYLFYWFRHNKGLIQNTANNAVVPILNNKTLEQIKIPMPPLVEQQKIAAILDAADSLRQKDQQLVERYAALSQSLFLEMFGDPVTNPMGWSYTQLNNLVSKLGDGLHGTPEYSDDGEYFFINGNNLNHGAIEFFPETKKVSKSEFDKHKKDLNHSTMLVSINGSIGKVAFYNGEKIILGKSACYFNINESLINKIYLFRLIESSYFLKYAMGSATGSTIKNVSLKTMRAFPVPMPPINMQNQFAERIQLIEAQKQQAQRSLEKSEALFNSLLQRAFTGELTAKMAALLLPPCRGKVGMGVETWTCLPPPRP